MKRGAWWSGALVAVLLAGLALASGLATCGEAGPGVECGHQLVDPAVAPDAGVEAFLAPLRADLDQRVNEVIGQATGELKGGKPESSLGNFVSDVMREAASKALSTPVDVAVTNSGGLRAPIGAGPVTLRTIYEVMPFENRLMVVTLSGEQLLDLARQIAASGGVPQSGLRIVFRKGELVDASLAGGRAIVPERKYRVATTDYLLGVGEKLVALKADPKPQDVGVTVRDALIQAVRERKTLVPSTDRRTRGARKGE
jgi:2',3'-cyclic-nucleotide 2'-phosphodiesterase (5'-nucleotidase family)